MSLTRSLRIIEGISPNENGRDAPMLKEFLKMTDWDYEICNVFRSSKSSKKSSNKRKFLKNFLERKDRFIHISAHGIDDGLSLGDTNETNITIDDIKAHTKKTKKRILEHKFITLSVCGKISNGFTVRLHETTSVTAVVSPLSPVSFAESALFSVLFYFSLSQFPPSCLIEVCLKPIHPTHARQAELRNILMPTKEQKSPIWELEALGRIVWIIGGRMNT